MNKLKVCVFSSQEYDQAFMLAAPNGEQIEFTFLRCQLDETSVKLAEGHNAVCVFVNDVVNESVLQQLTAMDIYHVCLRCTGYNNVDVNIARKLAVTVSRVPAYSPEAVAEHTIALILTLLRKTHKAYNRVKEDNFSLVGLMGTNLHGKKAGIVGAGKIGAAVCKILLGFGMKVSFFDPEPNQELIAIGAEQSDLNTLLTCSDVITLHCPLTPDTYHLISESEIETMKKGVMLINTSRGALIDTQAVVKALKQEHISNLALDVYEMESDIFFKDMSSQIVQDDIFQRLLTFPNVLITGHQGFFTREALAEISETTVKNLLASGSQQIPPNNLVT